MIEYIEGDLFASDSRGLAHGCNTRGVMGAGIALEFAHRYPGMYAFYQRQCQRGGFTLGRVLPWFTHNNKTIFNLATQDLPGPHADLNALRTSVTTMLKLAEGEHFEIDRIALPRIGCGIGGLDWNDVEAVLNELSDASSVKLEVHTL